LYMLVVPSTWEVEAGESQVWGQPRQSQETLPQKQNKKKNWGVMHVVHHLPTKHEVLGSIPSTTKKKKKE
jgi:hypothetical protein